MSLWHNGWISIQRCRTQRLSQVWRRSKGSRPTLSKGCWTGQSDISIGYWLSSTALWAPSSSRLHSVTPSFQLLICGTVVLNILPYALAVITFRRETLCLSTALSTGVSTTHKERDITAQKQCNTFFEWMCIFTCSSILYVWNLSCIQLSCSVMSYLNTFLLALAFTLVLMCCIV